MVRSNRSPRWNERRFVDHDCVLDENHPRPAFAKSGGFTMFRVTRGALSPRLFTPYKIPPWWLGKKGAPLDGCCRDVGGRDRDTKGDDP